MEKVEILDILKNYKLNNSGKYGILKLGLFGSVAHDQMNSDSDIDVVIETQTPNPFIIVHVKEELEEILQKPVDVVRYRESMNHLLKQRISRDAIYV